jgi:hypothetical protein
MRKEEKTYQGPKRRRRRLLGPFFPHIVPNRFVIVFSSPRLPLAVSSPYLQTTQRADARRRGAGAVVSPPPPRLPVVSSSSLALLLPVSTPEQLLAGLGTGAGASCWLSPCYPPCEQGLAAVAWSTGVGHGVSWSVLGWVRHYNIFIT